MSGAVKSLTLTNMQPYLNQELYTSPFRTGPGLIEYLFTGDVLPLLPEKIAKEVTIPETYCLHDSNSPERKDLLKSEKY